MLIFLFTVYGDASFIIIIILMRYSARAANCERREYPRKEASKDLDGQKTSFHFDQNAHNSTCFVTKLLSFQFVKFHRIYLRFKTKKSF